jgi:TfoX/Sxy family transcriptional regulator of competence genes
VAYDEAVAERIREVITLREDVTERKMFGGIAWMLRGNMACGVLGEDIIVRVGPENYERALAEPNTREFDFTGRPSRGIVVVGSPAIADDEALASWVDAGADFAASLPAK